jgi:hypothetical protein
MLAAISPHRASPAALSTPVRSSSACPAHRRALDYDAWRHGREHVSRSAGPAALGPIGPCRRLGVVRGALGGWRGGYEGETDGRIPPSMGERDRPVWETERARPGLGQGPSALRGWPMVWTGVRLPRIARRAAAWAPAMRCILAHGPRRRLGAAYRCFLQTLAAAEPGSGPSRRTAVAGRLPAHSRTQTRGCCWQPARIWMAACSRPFFFPFFLPASRIATAA